MLKIAVYAVTRTNDSGVRGWYESVKNADHLLIVDTSPSNRLLFASKSLGIRVEKVSVTPWRFDIARNAAIALTPSDFDVCISLDLSETLSEGWREQVEVAWAKGINLPKFNQVINPEFSKSISTVIPVKRAHPRVGFYWQQAFNEELVASPILKPVSELINVKIATNQKLPPKVDWEAKSDAIARLKEQVDVGTEDWQLVSQLIRELYQIQDWKEVILYGELLLKIDTKDKVEVAVSFILTSEAAWKLGLESDALSWATKAIETRSDLYEAWHWKAHILHFLGEWQQVFDNASMILKLSRGEHQFVRESVWTWWGYDLMALSAHKLGRNEEAIEYGERAVSGSPFDPRLQRNLQIYRGVISQG